MKPIIRLRILASIAVNAVAPSTKKGGALPRTAARSSLHAPPGFVPVPLDSIPFYLADPDRAANGRGELALFFPGAPALAAPFLLFRLKRLGFSRCRAEARDGGVTLTARR